MVASKIAFLKVPGIYSEPVIQNTICPQTLTAIRVLLRRSEVLNFLYLLYDIFMTLHLYNCLYTNYAHTRRLKLNHKYFQPSNEKLC